MKHKKYVVDSAKKRPNPWQVSKVKITVIYATRFCVNWAFLIAREPRGQIETRA
jgi:hypothetical protein